MASSSAAVAKHATLTSTTVDTVTLTQGFDKVEVINRDSSNTIYIRYGAVDADVTAPTAAGDDCLVIMPGGTLTVDANSRGGFVVKIIGNGGDYSVQGVDG